ncbi:FAD/NAD(P)-binding protein [Allofustis seminis]|uniref:FAD/NAD(P)-binding protein n=1 Tax=Allofustis seminis TaxID=166939 RepID=UPI0003636415|nr:FAD/NAD(P)-binding protein [Allofustis seminis]
MKIAIVGMGVAGGNTLRSLYEKNAVRPSDEIHVYEDRLTPGVGLPYQPDDDRLILNSFSMDVSLNPDDPDEYVKFLEEHYPGRFGRYEFTPRMIFGEYATQRFAPYLEKEEVQWIKKRVTRLTPILSDHHPDKLRFCVQVDQNRPGEIYDAVFLAVGHPPYADYYGLKGQPGYIHEPFPVSHLLEQIDPSKDRVGIVGSSLTALDVMEYLQESASFAYPLTFYTLHEPFATVKDTLYEGDEVFCTFDDAWIEAHRLPSGKIALDDVLAQFKKDLSDSQIHLDYIMEHFGTGSLYEVHQQLQQADEQLLKFQYYIALLSPHMTAIVNALDDRGRRHFFETYRPWYEYFHVQLSKVKMEKIWKGYLNGTIRFVREIVVIEPAKDKGVVIKTAHHRTYHADVLINATGFETRLSYAAAEDPLIHSLLEADLMMPSPQQDVAITWPGSQPLSRTYGVVDNLYLSGFWIGTTQYPNNNVQRAAQQGARMVDSFKKNNHR